MRGSSISILFLCMFFCACHTTPANKKVLPLNTMKLAMWDLMKADEWFTQTNIKDTAHLRKKENIQLYEQVFKIHGINRTQFFNSYAYFEAHPPEFKILIDSVLALANREKVEPKALPLK